jgi:tRNA (mo5U34)-methyltransferase
MTYEQIKDGAEKIKWFHSIELTSDDGRIYTTNGMVNHCTEEIANNRYGLPLDLSGKTVLDIGTFDGYFAFLAEKRGAKVIGIDPLQGCSHFEQGTDGFNFAKSVLNSNVEFYEYSLYDYRVSEQAKKNDIVLYYGVLYHVKDPLKELRYLSVVTKEYALIETAIAQNDYGNKSVWEFNHGFDNDSTNYWYPSIKGLENTLKFVGFKTIQTIYNDGIRATIKASK